ncbi:MAG: hypothetical protein HYZ84_07950 [Candidatus Omnitrophica bacterium]|nr:hypothetical protein [Candidatus Omnitrophota bacterium]
MLKKIIIFAALLAVFLFLILPRAVGFYLEPKLERKLTQLFGMKVTIEYLRGQPLTGHVWANRITFWNQPQFSDRPHLDIRGIEFDIDYMAIRQKRVIIRNAVFHHSFYLLERISTDKGTENNIVTWWHHIRHETGNDVDSPDKEDDGSRWYIFINRVRFRDGTFIYHDRTNLEAEKKLVFQKFNAVYEGFAWRTLSPLILSQRVFFSGLFGEKKPAPFRIYGRANFATSDISFRLDGMIKGGDLAEQKNLWEGLPMQIVGGEFDLKTRAVCVQDYLKSKSLLIMKNVKVAPRPSPAEKIWGYPLRASMGFLQNKKIIRLKVPVQGDISDPKFGFWRAFRVAFQESLQKKVVGGVRFLLKGTAKLATHTREVLVEAPTKLAIMVKPLGGQLEKKQNAGS